MAVDPESWLRIYPEVAMPEDQKKAWLADRTGAVVGIETAKRFGWKIGDRVPLQGVIYQRPDRGPWEFTIRGIYESPEKGSTTASSSSTTTTSTRRSGRRPTDTTRWVGT